MHSQGVSERAKRNVRIAGFEGAGHWQKGGIEFWVGEIRQFGMTY